MNDQKGFMIMVTCDMNPCSSTDRCQHFRRTYCLYI